LTEPRSARAPRTYVQFANIWIIINSGDGPTPDKPEIVLAAHDDPNQYDTFLNLRVADIHALYNEWRGRGAEFLTPPLDNHGYEMRCYMRDPDGRIIEVGTGDWLSRRDRRHELALALRGSPGCCEIPSRKAFPEADGAMASSTVGTPRQSMWFSAGLMRTRRVRRAR